jgi:enterochelin esterase-like enzyme
MINRRALLAGAAALALPVRAAMPAGVERLADLEAPGLLPRRVDLWLPPGVGDRPLDLLIMHDGQNLFDPGLAYGGVTWGVAETAARLVAAGSIRPLAIAGVWNTPQRWADYAPAAIIEALPQKLKAEAAKAMAGPALQPLYTNALADRLLPALRQRLNIRPGKVALVGSSMGGLVSLASLAQRPDTFDRAGCLSIHWPLLGLDPIAPKAVQAATAGFIAKRLGPPAGRRLWLDHGDQGLDRHYAPYAARANAALQAAGWQMGTDFMSQFFPGTGHNEASWAARLALTFTFLFKDG